MLWFNKEKKKKMEFIQNYVPTSKAQLIQVAMYFNNGNIEKAQEMVDFYSRNLNLPDFDPVHPTMMQQIKANVGDLYSWIKDNQGDIINGWQFIQSMIHNKGVVIPEVSEPLQEINE